MRRHNYEERQMVNNDTIIRLVEWNTYYVEVLEMMKYTNPFSE